MTDEHVHQDFNNDALFTILSETENLTQVGGWAWDVVQDNWTFSDNWLRIHGCAKRHLVTSELLQIAHPDDRSYVHKAFKLAIAEGKNYEIEHRIVRQDTGEERFIRAHGKSIRDSDGKIVKIYGAAQDITEFRQTEKKLRRSEDKIASLVNNLPGVAYQFLLDKEGAFRFKYMGDNCIKLFGIKADKILQDANLVFDLIPQPDADEVQKKIMTSAQTLTPYDIEHRVIKKNGESVWVHAISTPWKNAGGDIVWDGIGLDITKKRQAEKALEKKSRLLKRITENMFDMVSMSDLEGNYTFAGKSHERILGYATSDLIGKNVMDFVHPDDLPIITREFQSLLKIGGTKTVQYRNRHNLGYYLWFETIGELLLDKSQNPSEIIFSTRDISEHKKAQALLKENEQRYKSAQRMGQVGNWELDLLTEKFWGSEEAKRIYGLDPQKEFFTTDEVENCIPDRKRVHQALVDLIEKGKPYNLEFEIRPDTGSEKKYIKSIAKVVKSASGKPIKIIGVIQNITELRLANEELRKSEQKFRILFESSKDALYISTIQGKIIEANQSFFEIFSYDIEDLCDLRTLDLYVNPNDRTAFLSEIERNGFAKDFEEKLQDKNGKEMDCLITATFRRSADGTIIGYQGIIRNVTEIKRRQIERENLILELQKALAEIKTLSGLLPICSHCKKIRDDKGYWTQIESYIHKHSDAKFSHSICQECAEKYYPDMDIYGE